uniref:uncharacterized protein LOC118153817 n=1 Tax=Callithrix jacchus TaxID=9483 RepID=UPI0023DD5835|nr:uncharacterized protein LOC118153817 [Callithrix jacchus]
MNPNVNYGLWVIMMSQCAGLGSLLAIKAVAASGDRGGLRAPGGLEAAGLDAASGRQARRPLRRKGQSRGAAGRALDAHCEDFPRACSLSAATHGPAPGGPTHPSRLPGVGAHHQVEPNPPFFLDKPGLEEGAALPAHGSRRRVWRLRVGRLPGVTEPTKRKSFGHRHHIYGSFVLQKVFLRGRDPRWPIANIPGLQLSGKARRTRGRHTFRQILVAHGAGDPPVEETRVASATLVAGAAVPPAPWHSSSRSKVNRFGGLAPAPSMTPEPGAAAVTAPRRESARRRVNRTGFPSD